MEDGRRSAAEPRESVELMGVHLAAWTEAQVVEYVMGALGASTPPRGGWILTPNVDILRQIVAQPNLRELLAGVTVTVPDGMPLLWAATLQGGPRLPERVTGASLLHSLCSAAADQRRSVFLLGGEAGVAQEAVAALVDRHPDLPADGWSPPFGIEATEEGMQQIRDRLRASAPDLVFCGFGFPKQERLIAGLVSEFPDTWFVGCGAALTFAAGRIARAPGWMQRTGLEWLHRLAREPRRMYRRYIVDGLPFVGRLLGGALLQRVRPRRRNRGRAQ